MIPQSIYFSTDCVFSGKKGNYSEADTPDNYGERGTVGPAMLEILNIGNAPLVIRSSTFDRERNKESLLQWALKQTGDVYGEVDWIYQGTTTLELARCVKIILRSRHVYNFREIYHIGNNYPISKYQLLALIRDRFDLKFRLHQSGRVRIDRSLNTTKFRAEFNYRSPTWAELIDEVAREMGR